MANNWRDSVDASIRSFLEMQIREASRHKSSYKLSSSPSNAQLWIAVANLSKQLFDINLKLNYIERALRDMSKRPEKVQKTKKLVRSLKKL